MLNHKIEIVILWIIIKILICDKIKTLDINQINQTQKNKALDENIRIKNQINNNKTRVLQTADYEPIRIYLDTYDFNNTLKVLRKAQTEIDLINRALNKAKNTLEKLIKVQRESNVIKAQDYQNLINADFNNDYINVLSDILRI
jgi:Fe-S cluster assembly scaffold protein SufB